MATPSRKRSASGVYHAMQRGVNRYDIFEDDEDRIAYLDILRKIARKRSIVILVWCLMSNHVHLLLIGSHEDVVDFMRDLGSIYAKYFNKRHCRTGPLFEGRFKSVCVETEAQVIAVVRYIHRNPLKHGETTRFWEYPWSSFREYLGYEEGICKISLVLNLFGGIAEFVRIHNEPWPFERHLDVGVFGRMSDKEARDMANVVLEGMGVSARISEIGSLARNIRDEALALVKRMVGCSFKQLQRLTAVPYSAIRKAVAIADEDIAHNQGEVGPLNPAIVFVSNVGYSLLREAKVGGSCAELAGLQVFQGRKQANFEVPS